MQSVAITVIWPPKVTINTARPKKPAISRAKVGITQPETLTVSGRSQKYIMNLAPTAGKRP